MREIAAALERVLQSLERLEIRYMIGGSLASSIHGVERSTRDIDIVAAVRPQHTAALSADLSKDFYIDADDAAEALRRDRSFNLIHFATSHKFDVFPVPGDPYYQTQLERCQPENITFAEGIVVRCPVASAEDTILNKLRWYRLGGEQSGQQWNDMRGIVAVQGNRLDRDYLRKWAQHLKVEDFLDRLLGEFAA